MTSYTKLPNHIVDAMPDMSKAELKVTIAIVRHTYGYHKNECKLTFSELEELTGMSRGGVAAGVKSVVERGFFVHSGSAWAVYSVDQNSLVNRPNEPENSLVNRPEQSNSYTGSVYSVDQNTPVLKKDKESNKESDGDELVFADAVAAYENNIAMITPVVSDEIGEMVDELGAGWVIDAIKIAAKQNKRNWAYVAAILRNWKALGYQDIKQKTNGHAVHNGTANSDGSFF